MGAGGGRGAWPGGRGRGAGSAGGGGEGLAGLVETALQPGALVHDLALGVEHGDEVGVGELAAGLLLVFHAEQRGEFPHGVGGAVEEDPAGVEAAFLAVAPQRGGRVAGGVEGDQHQGGALTQSGRQRLADAGHVADEQRAGVAAGGEKHRQHHGAAAQGPEGERLPGVVGEAGLKLVEGLPGEVAGRQLECSAGRGVRIRGLGGGAATTPGSTRSSTRLNYVPKSRSPSLRATCEKPGVLRGGR